MSDSDHVCPFDAAREAISRAQLEHMKALASDGAERIRGDAYKDENARLRAEITKKEEMFNTAIKLVEEHIVDVNGDEVCGICEYIVKNLKKLRDGG